MTDEAMSPLRRRMIEDMTIRKLGRKTQQDYVQIIKKLAAFLGRSPDTATFEDLRRFQLHVVASGVGAAAINRHVSALRFFFRVKLKRYAIVEHTHFILYLRVSIGRPHAICMLWFFSGNERMRLPVAAKIALSTAGAATQKRHLGCADRRALRAGSAGFPAGLGEPGRATHGSAHCSPVGRQSQSCHSGARPTGCGASRPAPPPTHPASGPGNA